MKKGDGGAGSGIAQGVGVLGAVATGAKWGTPNFPFLARVSRQQTLAAPNDHYGLAG